MFLLLFVLVRGYDEDRKDEYCYFFSSNYIQGKANEIEQHVTKHPALDTMQVTSKLIEQAFHSCLDNMREEHFNLFHFDNIHEYRLYEEFIKVDLDSLKTEDDLVLTVKFNEKRKIIKERARARAQKNKEDEL